MAVKELLDQSISSSASTTPLLSKLSSEPKPSNSQTAQFTLVATTASTTTEKQEPPHQKKSQDSNNNSIVSVKQNVKEVEVTSETSQSAVVNPVSSRTPPASQQKVCSGASESVAALIVKEFGKFEPTTPEEDIVPPRKPISGRRAPNLTETEEEKSLLTALADYMELHAIHPVVKSFLVGSISGTCSTVLFQPLDLLKTRLQLQAPKIRHGALSPQTALRAGSVAAAAATAAASPNNFFTVLNHVVRNEKVFGLWKGMTPSLTRCVPGVGLYFASIHGLKIAFDIHGEPTAVQSVLLGVTGRSISGVMMIPFTVIKTRFESTVYHYGSIREALYCIYRKEGFRGLTCGLLPTLLRDAPFSGLYLLMYTSTKRAVPQDWIESTTFGPYVRFSCGIVAGIGASLITQPADVLKTKMQLYPDKFHSIPQVAAYVYKKYGAQGYFKGLLPRMIRRTMIAAMSWTVYEQMMKSMGLK